MKRADAGDDVVLAFIQAYVNEHGFAPTTKEIGDAVGLASKATVHKRLVSLRDAGRLEWRPNATRTMRVLDVDAG